MSKDIIIEIFLYSSKFETELQLDVNSMTYGLYNPEINELHNEISIIIDELL